LPESINIGMTPDQFWYESPELLWAYNKAYNSKADFEQKKQSAMLDAQTWAIGVYVTHAISATFGKGKFPQTPDRIFREPESVEETRKRVVAQIHANMANVAATMNAKQVNKDGIVIGEPR